MLRPNEADSLLCERAQRDEKEPSVDPAMAYEAEFDYPSFSGAPKLQVMVASVPRSGSTHFCSSLWQTGLVGSPLEYFNFVGVQRIRRRFPTPDMEEYWLELTKRRTSPNGVFSYKLFIPDLINIASNAPDLLTFIKPDIVIYLLRHDVVAHAVSYAIAAQTGAWFHNQAEVVKPVYSRHAINKHISSIQAQQDDWEETFKHMEVNPIRLTYEDFLSAEDDQIAVLLDALGQQRHSSAPLIDIPRPRRQSGERNKEWIARYHAGQSRMRFLHKPSDFYALDQP